MSGFVNKIKTKDGTEYDIQDKRIDNDAAEGKFLSDDFTWKLINTVKSMAPEYDSTATYKAGDMVIYDDALYQAKAEISTAEEWNAEHWDEVDLVDALPKFLKGKFVRIMAAPSSTTLTDEQIAQIKEGVVMNGTFLGYKNPMLFPYEIGGSVLAGWFIGGGAYGSIIGAFKINESKVISLSNQSQIIYGDYGITFNSSGNGRFNFTGKLRIYNKEIPQYPANTENAQFICRKGTLEWYIPVAQTGITSGDTIALDSDLGKALIDHLEVEINGHRCRYERTNGNYIVYSWKDEADSGVNLEINMISYNTTNGTLSFNIMKFAPVI